MGASRFHSLRHHPTMPDSIEPLRAALAVSPDNAPLRQHLADTLFAASRFVEAVVEYRTLLDAKSNDAKLKVQLADAYFQDGSSGILIGDDRFLLG